MTSALSARGSTRQWRKIRATVLLRDGHICRWCGAEATEVDHILPRHAGGGDEDWNLVSACSECNRGRARVAWLVALENPEALPLLDKLRALKLEQTKIELRILALANDRPQSQLCLDLGITDLPEQLGLL